MESLRSQLLIPDLAAMVCEYHYPDYKKLYDAVLRDLNWVAGEHMLLKLGFILDDTYDDDDVWEKATSMIQRSHREQYDRVMAQLDGSPLAWSCDRFFTKAEINGTQRKR